MPDPPARVLATAARIYKEDDLILFTDPAQAFENALDGGVASVYGLEGASRGRAEVLSYLVKVVDSIMTDHDPTNPFAGVADLLGTVDTRGGWVLSQSDE